MSVCTLRQNTHGESEKYTLACCRCCKPHCEPETRAIFIFMVTAANINGFL